MGLHRIALPGATLAEHEPLLVEGDEAHHARRVKRLEVGDRVEVLDCAGGIGTCRVVRSEKLGKREGWRLEVLPERIERHPPLCPRLEILSEPPKGPDLERMIDQLSQLGASSWSPLACHRSEVDPRPGKIDRLARTALEASKQCGRAWAMGIGERMGFGDAIGAEDGMRLVVAHMSGGRYVPTGAEHIRLLVGPVGDLTEGELNAAREAGATIASFGPLTMRIDTACCAAAAIIVDRERSAGGDH